MAASYRFVVTGRVQGVGMREAARRKAQQLDLSGWVMNRADGAVEGLVSGEATALARFHTWLSDGPPLARVLTVEWQNSEQSAGAEFVIRA